MKIKSFLLLVVLFSGLKLDAQNLRLPQKEEMGKLSALIGDWEGTGWYQQGQNQRYDMVQHEHIESKLDGTLLLVEGKGYVNDSLIFNAIAMFSYDLKEQTYKIESHLSDGKATVGIGAFNDSGKFIWGFEVPQGQIKYTITFTDTSWNEYGEYSADGNQWWKFMEMNLTKR